MGQFESDIRNAAHASAKLGNAPTALPLAKRCENFALDNIHSLAFGACAAIIGLASTIMLSGPQQVADTQPAAPLVVGSITSNSSGSAQWTSLRKPVEMIALQAPQFDRMPATYSARRSAQNDREDALTWSSATPGAAEAHIAVTRWSVPATAQSLFIEMSRTQADRGVSVTRSGAPGVLETKFGPLEAADMTFSDASGVKQACLAVRSMPGSQPVRVSGWYCATQGATIERPEFSCFIDRLALLKSGEDKDLRRFFTEAEQRRKPCPNPRVTAGRKPTWMDHDGKQPTMRGADDITTGSIGKRQDRVPR